MTQLVELKIPDIGDFSEVEVIEVLVAEGDTVEVEQSLITVESDKASMEIPAERAGVVKSLKVKVGDKVSEGSVILELEPVEQSEAAGDTAAPADDSAASGAQEPAAAAASSAPAAVEPASAAPQAASTNAEPAAAPTAAQEPMLTLIDKRPPGSAPGAGRRTPPVTGLQDTSAPKPHASPSVRKFARELGVDLYLVPGTGPKQRITHDDVRNFVKRALATSSAPAASTTSGDTGAALGLLPWPKIDFAKFGPIETQPLTRIKKISGANLHRNWVMIPHVTNNDEADVTELEALRQQLNRENEKSGVKVTLLAFLIKAVVAALKKFPEFNASLDGDNLVLKQYYHIGFAADTPNGLVVPVIRDADQKGILELAQETAALAKKAREGKLSPGEMQGGCFSISSLGGIGGTHFTPIINAPEVAILGVSRTYHKPVWDGTSFVPRLTLPLSLSYDHRVIDGAAAARFNAYLAGLLADMRRVLL